jgi:hypothetical protein
MKTLTTFTALTAAVGLLSPAAEAQSLSATSGQLSAPVQWIGAASKPGGVHMAQRTRDGRLILTPNESFFPRLGLAAAGTGIVPDVGNLNGGKSFEHIAGWDPGDQTEWGLWLETPGRIDVEIRMSDAAPNDRFSLTLGNGTTREFKADDAVQLQIQASAKGLQVLRLEKISPNKTNAKLHWIRLSGAAIQNAAVLRKRWRPAAAHTRFSSPKARDDIRLWVMEMDAAPGSLGFYSPITTPFGYYGPTWKANGIVNTGFNFSLWSFGRGKEEPPIEQLSHLIAIGDPDAKFSGFGHEGTGVKIRGWEPLKDRQGQRQAIALRVEPGDKYDTYFSYFYASDEKRWRLFGAGKKYNKGRPLKSLWVGSFVEVPGPPPRQRTGPYVRQMRYRGWVMDSKGRWSALDQMTNGDVDKKTGLTYTDRGLTDDGRFYMETGGWEFRKAAKSKHVTAVGAARAPLPDFMKPDAVKPLLSVPSKIASVRASRSGSRATVSFNLKNAGSNPSVTVYWGGKEGLTFTERWEKKINLSNPREGANRITLTDASAGKPLFIRIFIKNDEGQFWSNETLIAK